VAPTRLSCSTCLIVQIAMARDRCDCSTLPTSPESFDGKPTQTAGSVSDRGQEAARQLVFGKPGSIDHHRVRVSVMNPGKRA
jgi:hypothetical protein